MAFPTLQTWVTGQIVEASDLNSDVRDASRYLKGQDGAVTIEDSFIIQTANGKYLQVPSMATANLPAAPVAGMVVYDSTVGVFKRYENGAWVAFTDLAKMTIASIAQGDVFYRGASVVERLGAGTAGYVLSTGGAGANPVWRDGALVTAPVSAGASSIAELDGPSTNIPVAGGILHIIGTYRQDGGFTLTLRFRDAALGGVTAYGSAFSVNVLGSLTKNYSINGTSVTIESASGNPDLGIFHAIIKPVSTGAHKLTLQFNNSDADNNVTASAYWTI